MDSFCIPPDYIGTTVRLHSSVPCWPEVRRRTLHIRIPCFGLHMALSVVLHNSISCPKKVKTLTLGV